MQSAREALFLLLSIPFYLILIGAEIIFSNLQQKKYYSVRDTVQNIYFTLLNTGLDGLLRGLFYISVLAWGFQHHFLQFDNPYGYLFLLFMLVDLAFYVEHRVDHYCRLFCAIHVTHHSSGEFNLTTGFRSSVFQPVYRFIYLTPLPCWVLRRLISYSCILQPKPMAFWCIHNTSKKCRVGSKLCL